MQIAHVADVEVPQFLLLAFDTLTIELVEFVPHVVADVVGNADGCHGSIDLRR